jgi:hypothetical protein
VRAGFGLLTTSRLMNDMLMVNSNTEGVSPHADNMSGPLTAEGSRLCSCYVLASAMDISAWFVRVIVCPDLHVSVLTLVFGMAALCA